MDQLLSSWVEREMERQFGGYVMHSKVHLWTFLGHIHKNNMNNETQLLAPEKCVGAVDDRFLLLGPWLNY